MTQKGCCMKSLILACSFLLLSTVSARAQEPEPHPRLMHAAIAGAILAHGADLSTTSWAMGRAGHQFREANPIMRPFAGDPVLLAGAKMGLAVGLNAYLLHIHKKHPRVATALAVGQMIGFGYVAHRNAKTLGLR